MTDRTFSMGTLVAWGFIVISLALLVLGSALRVDIVGDWGIAAAIGGGVAVVRGYFVRQQQAIQDAYRLGRDAQERRVTSVH